MIMKNNDEKYVIIVNNLFKKRPQLSTSLSLIPSFLKLLELNGEIIYEWMKKKSQKNGNIHLF